MSSYINDNEIPAESRYQSRDKLMYELCFLNKNLDMPWQQPVYLSKAV